MIATSLSTNEGVGDSDWRCVSPLHTCTPPIPSICPPLVSEDDTELPFPSIIKTRARVVAHFATQLTRSTNTRRRQLSAYTTPHETNSLENNLRRLGFARAALSGNNDGLVGHFSAGAQTHLVVGQLQSQTCGTSARALRGPALERQEGMTE